MSFDHFMQEAPLPVIAVLLLAALAASRELGAWLHHRLARRADDAARETSDEGYVLSAVLGLLALLLAFTFGLALDRYEARRNLVVDEANALSTAFMNAGLLADPQPLRGLLRDYAKGRLAFGESSDAAKPAAAARARALSVQIETRAVADVKTLPSGAVASLVLGPVNEALGAASARQATLAARLPGTVVAALVVYILLSAAMLGYAVTGAGGRHRLASTVFFLLLTLTITLILDLDRPRGGAIYVSQAPMAQALADMHAP